MKRAATLAVAMTMVVELAATAQVAHAAGLPSPPRVRGLVVPRVRIRPVLPQPPGVPCLEYETSTSQDGVTTDVTVTVRNRCAPTVRFDAEVVLHGTIVGTSHEWMLDTARLGAVQSVQLHGSVTQGIVAQRACTRLQGVVSRAKLPGVLRPVSDDRCGP